MNAISTSVRLFGKVENLSEVAEDARVGFPLIFYGSPLLHNAHPITRRIVTLFVGWEQGVDSHCYGNSDALNAARMLFGMPFGRARLGPVRFKESRINSKSRFSGES